jgi:hypothetical protein
MSCRDAHRIGVSRRRSRYAASEDFRKLFTEGVSSLYLLSFLLTADREKADRCFVAGLADCVDGNPVFKEWANSWTRSIIIHNAIWMIAPHLGPGRSAASASHSTNEDNFPKTPLQDVPFASVLALEDFERFVFLLSVLERYTNQNCAALLGARIQDIREARIRALHHVAEFERRTAAPTMNTVIEPFMSRNVANV